VFDHDVVSKDDLMGEAEIDLPTMINAATAFGDPELLGDIQIGRWLRSDDNALIRDSAVVVADGKVKQGVTLKLQPRKQRGAGSTRSARPAAVVSQPG
jgi:stromal membrane-associated protein